MAGVRRKRSAFEGLKGLRSQSELTAISQPSHPQNNAQAEGLTQLIPWSAIVLPAKQPRRYFDEVELDKLAASIREHGILEPLIVRPLASGQYGLVAGERRYRAAKLAEQPQIPVVVRVLSDEQAWEIALLENVQRQDLNAVDKVDAVLQELAFKLRCSVPEAKSALYRIENENKGKVTRAESGNETRVTVERVFEILGIRFSHFMRFELPLLKAPESVLAAVRAGQIDVRHANEIRRVKDSQQQKTLLKEAIENKLSVEAIRTQVKNATVDVDAPVDALQERVCKALARVKKARMWACPQRRQQLEVALTELEQLLEN